MRITLFIGLAMIIVGLISGFSGAKASAMSMGASLQIMGIALMAGGALLTISAGLIWLIENHL